MEYLSTVGCLSNLTAGTYSVTVSGSHGCSVSAFANLTLPTPLVDSIAVNNTGCQGCSYTSGGTPPYVFLWSNGNVGACTALSEPGIYIHWVTDTHNCTLTDTVSTIQTNPMHLRVFEPDSNSVPDTVSIIIRGGTPPYTVNWNNTSFVSLPDSSGTYVYGAGENSNMQVMDSFGCDVLYRFDVGCTDQCIWPGDANYDGLVDNNDLLPIGVAYDSTGYTRMNATINFIPQYCVPWNDTLPSGVNYKHIDCNGDGTINADDTVAILLNYGHTHPRGGGAQPWKNNAPVLHVTLSPDTLVDGEIATATLSLGDSALPCTNVYALAFTYNFDPLVVDTQSVSITFGNSWLAGPGDHINIGKTFYNSGELQTALTRIDHTNRSGQGVIGTVSMKITTGNINGKNIQYYLMNSFVNNLTVIDNAGNVLPFNAGADSAHLAFTPTNIIPVPGGDTHLQIFPNPATDQLNISSDLSDITEISINDLAGKSMLVQRMRSASATLNIAELSAGVYIINIQKEGQEYRQRFVKISLK